MVKENRMRTYILTGHLVNPSWYPKSTNLLVSINNYFAWNKVYLNLFTQLNFLNVFNNEFFQLDSKYAICKSLFLLTYHNKNSKMYFLKFFVRRYNKLSPHDSDFLYSYNNANSKHFVSWKRLCYIELIIMTLTS